eukprot:Skav219100  [mRNA]  locus=scaffold1574:186457:196994:+ [translate_table: standard]
MKGWRACNHWRPIHCWRGRSISAVGLAGALAFGAGSSRCEEPETLKMFRLAMERYMPSAVQEIETGRIVLEQVNEARKCTWVSLGDMVLEQNELRTEDWKKQQAMQFSGMTSLEGDATLYQDLLRYAKLADVVYCSNEELQVLEQSDFFLQVLLGVAGTHTVADCLTDALCDTIPITDDFGFAHRGAVEASAWLCAEYGESLKYLEDTPNGGTPKMGFRLKPFVLLVKEKGYEVILVGHSLGAAVAAVCCVQLRASGVAARCVCFAPPATMDPTAAALASSYITSVVHDDDCIPRMSILSLLDLCPGGYGVIKASDTDFRSIELSPSMVTDHFLSSYISCLAAQRNT